ncbi:GEVED domain-containing protein, partial [Phaeodactylibacter xiamenensis]|uniref:GEVED domain-containing protein n=1 Tax=Phaeodactylibacter xiamenensis TaxID=1524460 RepID=UPI0024A89B1C
MSTLYGQSCNCTEYIYLNDPGLDIVHKFSVDGGGAVTEIGTPWLDNINRPHGLGVDINGFLYIAREEAGPTWIIGKYTCDGGVVDANWHTTNATFIFNMNADRDGNLVYHGTLDNFSSYNHVKIDLCTATEIGCSEVPGSSTWGFYVEEDGTFWGARPTFSGSTGSAIYTGNINNFGTSPTCGTASTTFVKDDAPLDAPNYWPFGIFVDNAGFIYLVNTDPQGSGFNAFGPSYITKYAPDGTFVASSVLDDDSTDGGWFGSRGIVVDEAGLIYVSVNDGSANVATTGSTCFAIFEDDGLGNLNFVSAVNNPVGVTGTDPKAMGITKECCPTASTQTIDETVCYDGSNTTSVSLQNFLDCGDGGIICEGQWVEDPANPAAFTFNDCDLTIDVDGIGCATYTLSKGPLTGLQQCGAFNITVNVCSVTPPAYGAITSIQGTCNSSFPNDDAGIEIVSITNADIAGISSAGAATYDGPSYNSDPATNPALFAVSGGTLNISNLEHNQTYVVRLFNQGNNCFEDIVVNTATISCGGSCNCTDYLYLNDTDLEFIHKFAVDETSGSVTEIGAPWFEGLAQSPQFTDPHGIAQDLNGNLYIATSSQGDIYQFDPFGNITLSPWLSNGGPGGFDAGTALRTVNYGFKDNVLYIHNNQHRYVYAIDLCTGSSLGRMELYPGSDAVSGSGPVVWGFYVDNNNWYAVQRSNPGSVYTGPLDLSFYTTGFGTPAHSGTLLFNLSEPATGSSDGDENGMGITRDAAGNFYVIERQTISGTHDQPVLVKYSPTGAVLGSVTAPADPLVGNVNNGVPGFSGARGVTYSAASDRVYVSSKVNCISVFETDLTELSALNYGNPMNGRPKAIGVVTECCATPATQNINNTICYDGVNNETIFLQEVLDCEGIIAEGTWAETADANGVFDYESCDNSITVTGAGCATYTLTSNGTGTNNQCGAFSVTVEICTTDPPQSGTPTTSAGTCQAVNVPNNDATVTIPMIVNSDIVGVSNPGATGGYDGPKYNSDATSNPQLFAVSGGSVTITGLQHNQTYVIRLFNMGNGCREDVTVTTATIDCSAPPFEAQISQLCDGDSPNEGTIIYATADNAPSGNWVLRTLNNPSEVWATGANGSLQEAVMVPVGTVLEIVDGNNIIGSDVATITNLTGGSTFFTTSDDDTAVEGDNALGCQNEEACPSGGIFDLIGQGFANPYSAMNPNGILGASTLGGPHNGTFNAVIFGNLTNDGTGDTEGRLAVEGNFTSVNADPMQLSTYTIGASNPAATGALHAPQGWDNLIVGGDVNHENPSLGVRGNILYNTATALPGFSGGFSPVPGIYRNFAPDVNWAGALGYFQQFSTDYSPANLNTTCDAFTLGTVDDSADPIILDAGGNSGVVVFNLASVGAASSYDFRNTDNAEAILVNVGGTNLSKTGGSIFIDGTTATKPYAGAERTLIEKTLWNFYEVTTISHSTFAWLGSFLAPLATTSTLNGGDINGQAVISGDVTQEGGFEFHNFCFTADFSSCVCINPVATVTPNAGNCVGGVVTDNASVDLTAVTNGDEAGISLGSTYSGPNYGDPANVDVSGGSGSFTGLINNTQYTIRVYNSNSACFTDYTVTTPDLVLPTVTLNDPADVCIDGSDMNFTATPMGGTFSTTASAGFTPNNAAGTAVLDVSAAGAGTYDVTYTFTDGNGCEASQTVSVEVFALPTVTLNDPADVCIDGSDMNFTATPMGGTFSTTASAGFTPNNAAGTAVLDVSAAGAGTYDVTYTFTDGNGCEASQTVSVEVFALPTVTLNDPADVCIDGSDMNFTATPMGGTFSTTAPAGFTPNNAAGTAVLDVSAAGAGTYDVTYTFTDGNGCEASQTVSVEIFALPTYTAVGTNPTVCTGTNGFVTISGLQASTMYILNYEDDGTAVGPTNVTSNASGEVVIMNLNAGNYTNIILEDPNGCSGAAASASLSDPAAPTVTLNDPADACIDGTDMSFTGSPAPVGGATGTFSSNAPAGFTDNGDGTASLDVSAAGAGVYTITYSYTDASGCAANQMVSVEVFALPTVTLNDPADVCIDGSDMNFTATPMGGTFSTTAPSGFTPNNAAGTAVLDVSAAGAGTYDVTYTFTDGNGCEASQTVSVEVFALPTVTFSPIADLCLEDGRQTLGGGMPTGGEYSGTGVTDNGNGETFDFDPAIAGAGTITVTYTYTDGNGCTNSNTATITVYGVDYGDLQDPPYATTAASNGAGHCVADVPQIYIGSVVDTETDGQPTANADGDGADEDGFNPGSTTFELGETATFTVDVFNNTGSDAELYVWFDWNNDGTLDNATERYQPQSITVAGSNIMGSTFGSNGNVQTANFSVPVPSTAVLGINLGTRFRFSTDTDFLNFTATSTGLANDGEVEDYLIMIGGFDYGDLPDAGPGVGEGNYETTTASNGPSHMILTDPSGNVLLKIGADVDTEGDGQPGANADGDGLDEDGFDPTSVMFVRGESQDITIPVMNMTGGDAKLTLYVDWDNDGDFNEPEEMISVTVADGQTSAILSNVTPPSYAVLNDDLGFRLRLTTDAAMSPTGPAPDGEVEDYLITVMAFDYGDLADSGSGVGEGNYETSSANGGPSHKIVTNEDDMVTLKIGADIDADADGQPSADADGDGADEDGFDPTSVMFVRGESQDITIPVMNMTGGDAKLTLYVDWDNDGDFNEPEEMISVTVADGQTSAILSNVTPPSYAVLNDDLGFRLRLTTDAAMSPTGPAPDGEVEDYLITVMAFDYGDLADSGAGTGEQNYETSEANGGPSHKIVTNEDDMVTLKIGSDVDDELDGQPSADADGDGADEDGFDPASVMFVAGQMLDIDIPVMNMTGSGAKLTLYIDWDNDGDFSDPEEMFSVSVPDGTNGNVTLADILAPEDAALNTGLGFRLRLTTDAAMSPTGPAPDGEVEDYEIMVMGFDYGDLSDSGAGTNPGDYETQDGSNGPSHKIVTDPVTGDVTLKIGTTVDAEANGQQSANADGDGADEDGVSLPMFVTGMPVNVPVNVMNMTTEVAKLTMFVDWNNDGDFEDDNEMYSVDVPVGATLVEIEDVTPPLTATLTVPVGVRFRLSTDAVASMSPTGPAPDGEVEDYLTPSMGFDFGDLNDMAAGTNGDPNSPLTPADYQTTLADDGARHKILTNTVGVPVLKIGAELDDEANGQPNATAAGDDNSMSSGVADPDDEDGLDLNNLPLFILTQTTTLDIPVMNMSGEDATIAVYIDFNKDGVLDATTEKFTATVPDGATSAQVDVLVPVDAVVGQDLGLRIRLANNMAEVMSATGLANSGEVEDYMVQVVGFDYGDLPDTYTTSDPEAPKHIVDEDLLLGTCVDTEADGSPEAMAGLMQGGDDADAGLATFGTCGTAGDDEDGIVFVTPMIPGSEACIEVTAVNNKGVDAVLQMWVDWNGDGSFDAGEEVTFTSTNGNAIPDGGVNAELYCFDVPADAAFREGAAFVRFRLSEDGGLAPDSQTGVVPFGEIEDYKLPLGKVGNLVFEDYDFDGVQDANEPGIDGVTVGLTWLGPDNTLGTADDVIYADLTTGADDFDTGEYYFCGLIEGEYKITYTSPAGMTPTRTDRGGDDELDSDGGITGMDLSMTMETFVIENVTTLPEDENGSGDTGDVVGTFPDNQTDETHDQGFAFLDYGDLPDDPNDPNDYPTLMEEVGAVNVIIPGLSLGTTIDAELDGQPDAMADGEGADDDGITFLTPLVPGEFAVLNIKAVNTTGADAVLEGWIDWNGNGSLDNDEYLEWYLDPVNPSTGGVTIPYTVPSVGMLDVNVAIRVPDDATFMNGMMLARFRLNTIQVQLPFGPDKYGTDPMPGGEVEDYKLLLYAIGSYVWEDTNGNGLQDDFSSPCLNGLELNLEWAGPDGDLATTADNQTFTVSTSANNGVNGQYLFGGLTPGTYELSLATLPPGFTPTIIGAGSDEDQDSNDPEGVVIVIDENGQLLLGENGTGDQPGGLGYPDSQDNLSFDFGIVTEAFSIICNCDGSITLDWEPVANGTTWTIDVEDANGNPVVDFVNMSSTEVTFAPGTLTNGECYNFAITENLGNNQVEAILGQIYAICNPVPVLTLTGEGPTCPGGDDGSITVLFEEQGCNATYNIYLVEVGAGEQLIANAVMLNMPFVINGLSEGSYSVRVEVADRLSCAYGDGCLPTVYEEVFILENTDDEAPVKMVTDQSGNEPEMTIVYESIPEGECGVQFDWFVELDDNCPVSGLSLSAEITTSAANPSVDPSASVTLSNNGSVYVVSVHAGIGTNTLVLTATDEAGNINEMTYEITVVDNRPPEIYGPGDMQVQIPACEDGMPVNWQMSVIDDCDLDVELVQISGPQPGDVLAPGVYTVVYEATDDYGNTSQYSFDITVTQAQSPAPIVDVSGNGQFVIEDCAEDGFIVFSGHI